MRSPARRTAMVLLLMLVPLAASAAGDYWSYSYKNIDVTAEANSVFTVKVARYCAPLDALLVQILAIKTDYRVPAHSYVLAVCDSHRLSGADFSNACLTAHWTNTVLVDPGARPSGRPYWGAFFGYTAGLLTSEWRTGPDGYRVGVASGFADTVFEQGYVAYTHPQEAIQMAQEALRPEPANHSALRALARAQLATHAYAGCARHPRSPRGPGSERGRLP